MYKVSGELLQEIKDDLDDLIKQLWLSSQLTPDQFKELTVYKETDRLINILNLNYQTK